jgi:uncharacterized phage-associated protein
MKMPLPKLKAILLYFANNTDPRFLGKVKLMKLFYFFDFMHVKNYGSPVTFDRYVKMEHGPIPSTILNLVNAVDSDLDSAELSDTIRIEKSDESTIHRILPTRQFSDYDRGYFSETELEILEKVCARFGNKTTKFVEDASHKEAPWRTTQFLDEIPYTLASEDKDCVVDKETITLSIQLI